MSIEWTRISRVRSWAIWLLALVILAVGGGLVAIIATPFSGDALKVVLREDMLKNIEITNLTLKKKDFDFQKFRWNFEITAEVHKMWGIPLKIKNLSLQGYKSFFQAAEVRRAIIRFSDDDPHFKGGLALNKDGTDNVLWDLSNLEISLGSIEKRIGTVAFLNVVSKRDNNIKAFLLYDLVKLPLDITMAEKSIVVQIPKSIVFTKQQRLPFQPLSKIPTTGKWVVSSRIEFSTEGITEASSLQAENALVSISNVDSSLMRNGRGIGVLNMQLASTEGLVSGALDLNLDKATFELNDGRYFKVENSPFSLEAKIIQNELTLKVNSENNTLSASVNREGAFQAKLDNFDFSILPNTSRFFGVAVSGAVTGDVNGKLVPDNFGMRTIEVETITASAAKVKFEEFFLPLLEVKGPTRYEGSFSYDKQKISLDGNLDFSRADFAFADLYRKGADHPLDVRIRAESEDKLWKSFILNTTLEGQPLEIKNDRQMLTINIPRTFKRDVGSVISGSVSYPLCLNKICDTAQPTAFNLKLSDFVSSWPFLQGLKISGKVVKKADRFEASLLSFLWPSGDRVVVSGDMEKFKKADLKVTGDFDYKNVATSNPFILFKEMPVQQGRYDLSLNLRKEEVTWNLAGKANWENKKLNFGDLSFSQNAQKFSGTAQFDLEPYLLRNEAANLTSTLKTTGSLANWSDLLMRGKYSALVTVGTSGLNPGEFLARMKLRAAGDANLEQLPATLLISQGLESYAKERQKDYARTLARCYPKKLQGKFDFDYSQGKWNLAPSVFQGVDKDSMVKIQGSLGDLSSVNLISHYLPGPECAKELASCLGDAFPKGGMSFEITGPFKDPETDLDFAFIDQSLERCREIEAKRAFASDGQEQQIDTRDQRTRIKELKDFYNSRNLSR